MDGLANFPGPFSRAVLQRIALKAGRATYTKLGGHRPIMSGPNLRFYRAACNADAVL